MPTTRIETYDSNGNLSESREVEIPDPEPTPEVEAQTRFHEAIRNANSLEELKAAILGNNTNTQVTVRPGRPV